MSRLPIALLVLLLTALAPAPLPAQTPPGDTTATPAAAAAGEEPVPVPAPSARAVRYHRSGNVLWVIGLVWALLVPAVLLFSGVSAKMRDLAKRVGRGWLLTTVVYAALFAALTFVLDLPFAYYQGYVREHAYGLSNQTPGAWLSDQGKSLAVSVAGLALTLWIPYLLLRKSPRRWWLYTGLVSIPLVVLVVFITPLWIAPLFDDFGPMRDRALETRILALADRAGIQGGRVFEVDKSEDTDAVNAYVTGFGGSKRIVLWDTLLRSMDDREVLFVMGHEMGHYVLGHLYVNLSVAVALILLGLYAVYRSSGALIARFAPRFGFDRMDDVASLPLLLLVLSVVTLAAAPIANAVSRHLEHEADRFALEITRDNRAGAGAFVKLQRDNLAVPYPGLLYKLWRAGHPPVGERIEFANEYRPWERGEELKYGDRFE